MSDAGGNNERLVYLYDSAKLTPLGVAGYQTRVELPFSAEFGNYFLRLGSVNRGYIFPCILCSRSSADPKGESRLRDYRDQLNGAIGCLRLVNIIIILKNVRRQAAQERRAGEGYTISGGSLGHGYPFYSSAGYL